MIPTMALVPLKEKNPPSEDIPPTPTLAQFLDWAGSPVTAKHIQSLAPSSRCHPEKKKTQAFRLSQRPERVSYLKKSNKNNESCHRLSPDLSPAPPPCLHPFYKTPAGLVHRTIRIPSGAKSVALPSGISAFTREKKDRESQKSVRSLKCPPPPPPRGNDVGDKQRENEGD